MAKILGISGSPRNKSTEYALGEALKSIESRNGIETSMITLRGKKLELEGITCCVNYPIYKGQRVTMWSLIPMKKFPPTRLQRYCCQICYEKKVIMERNRRKHCYFKIFRL